eukprot:TRINITY_DN3507_c0_g1_i2.p1 TRINITY_DN3507_c0_g1~~TRINITY_DN3507_c0_g1_i2.p1  ORF type:complete len:416 (+),score=127.31 TRINITY_DN3507_c0_g1_i2:187-1434(+)
MASMERTATEKTLARQKALADAEEELRAHRRLVDQQISEMQLAPPPKQPTASSVGSSRAIESVDERSKAWEHDKAAAEQRDRAHAQKVLLVQEADSYENDLKRAKEKQAAQVADEDEYEMRKLAQTRPGLMRLLDTPMTSFAHIVDDEFQAVRQTNQAYADRQWRDEAEMSLLIRKAEIELDRRSRRLHEVEAALSVELRRHDLNQLANHVAIATSDRRVAERQRDDAGAKLRKCEFEANRLHKDTLHMRENYKIIEHKMRGKQRENDELKKKLDIQARVGREQLQNRFDRAGEMVRRAEEELNAERKLGSETMVAASERERSERKKRDSAQAALEKTTKEAADLTYSHGYRNERVRELGSQMSRHSTRSQLIGDHLEISREDLKTAKGRHERELMVRPNTLTPSQRREYVYHGY